MVIDEREYRCLVAARDPNLKQGTRSGFFPPLSTGVTGALDLGG